MRLFWPEKRIFSVADKKLAYNSLQSVPSAIQDVSAFLCFVSAGGRSRRVSRLVEAARAAHSSFAYPPPNPASKCVRGLVTTSLQPRSKFLRDRVPVALRIARVMWRGRFSVVQSTSC